LYAFNNSDVLHLDRLTRLTSHGLFKPSRRARLAPPQRAPWPPPRYSGSSPSCRTIHISHFVNRSEPGLTDSRLVPAKHPMIMLIPLAFVRDSRLVPGRLVGDVMLVPVLVVMVFVPFVGRREVGLVDILAVRSENLVRFSSYESRSVIM
jgi:hypothetical protein